MAGADLLVGGSMMGVGFLVFTYYSFWALILPFLEEDHPAQAYFLGNQMVIYLPLFLLVTGVTLIGGFIGSVLLKSKNKKKST